MIWFPIVQPVAEVLLSGSVVRTTGGIALLVVQLLGATYLLKSAGFLAIWFLVLWLILRWDTQRRINRMLSRWRQTDADDPARSLPTAVMNWVDELLDPIHVAARREETLAQKAQSLRTKVNA